MATICGAVIARDEAANIERCLGSLRWADSLLVILDDRTVDTTAELAARRGARVVSRRFEDFGRQRNEALEIAEADWVLFVDADEVVTSDLAVEVRSAINRAYRAGYWVPRKNILFGHWVRHAGWSPDYQLRLLHRDSAHYREDRSVHELVDLRGSEGYLNNPLIHYNYATVRQFLAKQRVYSAMEAEDMHRRGIRVKPQNYLLQPWRQFWRRFVSLRGYRDGWVGLLLSSLLAYYELKMYLRLTALSRAATPRDAFR